MNYAVILAGGVGSRVKSADIPKQFIEINGSPIIAYTLNSILKPQIFDHIYIATHKEWTEYMKELIRSEFSQHSDHITILEGGKERMDSIGNVISAINAETAVTSDDIIVIHDAARPFVSEKILCDSVAAAREYGAVVTAIGAADTMIYSESGYEVDDIPQRQNIYHGQAPDSFRLELFINMLDNLTEQQRQTITGTSQICTMNNHKLHMIKGDAMDFKITTDFDLLIAKQISEYKGEVQ